MEYNRKINRSGSVNVPAALRREYGIAPDEKLNIKALSDGTIEIKRIVGSCIFCGRNEGHLKKFHGRYVCVACLKQLGGMLE